MSSSPVKKVTVVGASGQIGGQIAKFLLSKGTFEVSALSREDSTSTFAPGIAVKKGDYSSAEFLTSALRGQDVLVITLNIMSPAEVQPALIRAACEAGVPFIIPNEFGQDGSNAALCAASPILGAKVPARELIESLGSSWIGIACNQWLDFSLKFGLETFGVDAAARKAELWDGGDTKIWTSTLAQTGKAVAGLLSLPRPELEAFRNRFVYVNSFEVTQKDILACVQRATGTREEEWTVEGKPLKEHIADGQARIAKGDMMGMMSVLYGSTFTPGLGDKFPRVDNEKLGLTDKEDFDELVKKAVQEMESTAGA